jgi:hypothetical protein
MNKYNSEEYFSVLDRRTGRKIADCGWEQDAINLVSFDPQNRTYTRNKFLMGPVVDIEIPKELPTSNITVSNVREGGCTTRKKQLVDSGPIKLPEGQGKPIVV